MERMRMSHTGNTDERKKRLATQLKYWLGIYYACLFVVLLLGYIAMGIYSFAHCPLILTLIIAAVGMGLLYWVVTEYRGRINSIMPSI